MQGEYCVIGSYNMTVAEFCIMTEGRLGMFTKVKCVQNVFKT